MAKALSQSMIGDCKCSSWCSDCKRKHHSLLLALIDTEDEDEQLVENLKAMCIDELDAGHDLDEDLEDEDPMLTLPILHWAAVFGRLKVLEMLLKPPFNLKPDSLSFLGETAMHRVVSCLIGQQTFTEDNYSVLEEIMDLLFKCFPVKDARLNTPLHSCAHIIASTKIQNKQELTFMKNVLKSMLNCVMINFDEENRGRIVNARDWDDDSVLHILSKEDKCCELIEHVIVSGADIDITNRKGESSLEIAWRCSMTVYCEIRELQMQRELEEKVTTNSVLPRRTRAMDTGFLDDNKPPAPKYVFSSDDDDEDSDEDDDSDDDDELFIIGESELKDDAPLSCASPSKVRRKETTRGNRRKNLNISLSESKVERVRRQLKDPVDFKTSDSNSVNNANDPLEFPSNESPLSTVEKAKPLAKKGTRMEHGHQTGSSQKYGKLLTDILQAIEMQPDVPTTDSTAETEKGQTNPAVLQGQTVHPRFKLKSIAPEKLQQTISAKLPQQDSSSATDGFAIPTIPRHPSTQLKKATSGTPCGAVHPSQRLMRPPQVVPPQVAQPQVAPPPPQSAQSACQPPTLTRMPIHPSQRLQRPRTDPDVLIVEATQQQFNSKKAGATSTCESVEQVAFQPTFQAFGWNWNPTTPVSEYQFTTPAHSTAYLDSFEEQDQASSMTWRGVSRDYDPKNYWPGYYDPFYYNPQLYMPNDNRQS